MLSKGEKMDTAVIETSGTTATSAKTQGHLNRVVDKHGDAVRAKRKKKRDAHRVALRRSHTKG
jgi:hypothetical protein